MLGIWPATHRSALGGRFDSRRFMQLSDHKAQALEPHSALVAYLPRLARSWP